MNKPLTSLIARKGSVVIDGAMSTGLESLGCDLNDALWSAKILIEDPDKIRTVHRNYFDAGANVAITASYQASEAGFAKKGIGSEQAFALIKQSVQLADEARREYSERTGAALEDLLIAGAVGPYGAYLANGAEYTGDYRLTASEFERFHALRMDALVAGGADFLGIETQPRLDEIEVLCGMAQDRGISAWVTMTLKDSGHLPDGHALEDAAAFAEQCDAVEAIGLNCVRRELAAEALEHLASGTGKPLIVYPNSGETYDPSTKTWHHPVGGPGWDHFIGRWKSLGAVCLGGCCRTLPADICQIAALMQAKR